MKKYFLQIIFCLTALVCNAQTPSLSFLSSHQFVENDLQINICYQVQHGYPDDYIVQNKLIVRNGNDELFVSIQNDSINLKTGEHCIVVDIVGEPEEIPLLSKNDIIFDAPEYSANAIFKVGEIPLLSILYTKEESGKQSADPSLIIRAFDNEYDEGFSISFLTIKPINRGFRFGLTNGNFDGDQIIAKDEILQAVNFRYEGIQELEPFSIICVHSDLQQDSLGNFNFTTSINNQNELFLSVNQKEMSQSFFSDEIWTNVLMYEGRVEEELEGTITDGVVVGIKKENYVYTSPFEWDDMLVFLENGSNSLYTKVVCDNIPAGCDPIVFFKDVGNWIVENGTVANDILLASLCDEFCGFYECQEELTVTGVCDSVLFDFGGNFTQNYDVNVVVSEGGEILDTINELAFLTNNIGQYSVNIVTEDGCEYSQTFSYNTGDCLYYKSDKDVQERKKSKEYSIQVYPVPTSENLYIDIDKSINVKKIEIFNDTGQLLRRIDSDKLASKNTISTRDLPSGIFMLRTTAENGDTFFNKFIVTK